MEHIRIITAAQIRAAIQIADLIEPMADAFRRYSAGAAVVPPVMILHVPAPGEVHVKAAAAAGSGAYVIKIASSFPKNPSRGSSPNDGMLVLFDSESGAPQVLLHDAGYLTDIRTAAAGAVAARLLAPRQVDCVTVFGTGIQARLQVQAAYLVRPFPELVIWGRDGHHAQELMAQLQGDLPDVHMTVQSDRQRAIEKADLIITATGSRVPLIEGAWLHPGQHITAVGADEPGKSELDDECLLRANRLVVDSREQNAVLGEVARALASGVLRAAPDELGELLAGQRPGRTQGDEITIAKLTGIGIQDLVAAETALLKLKG